MKYNLYLYLMYRIDPMVLACFAIIRSSWSCQVPTIRNWDIESTPSRIWITWRNEWCAEIPDSSWWPSHRSSSKCSYLVSPTVICSSSSPVLTQLVLHLFTIAAAFLRIKKRTCLARVPPAFLVWEVELSSRMGFFTDLSGNSQHFEIMKYAVAVKVWHSQWESPIEMYRYL